MARSRRGADDSRLAWAIGSQGTAQQTSDTFQADDFRISLESAITHHLVWKLI